MQPNLSTKLEVASPSHRTDVDRGSLRRSHRFIAAFFVLGIGLALATLLLRIVVPVAKQAAFVLTDPSLGDGRGRASLGNVLRGRGPMDIGSRSGRKR